MHDYENKRIFTRSNLGFLHDKNKNIGCQISDFSEFVDFFKRLTIPYYEEARQYFQEAMADGEIYGDENEIYLFSEEKLEKIVQKYNRY